MAHTAALPCRRALTRVPAPARRAGGARGSSAPFLDTPCKWWQNGGKMMLTDHPGRTVRGRQWASLTAGRLLYGGPRSCRILMAPKRRVLHPAPRLPAFLGEGWRVGRLGAARGTLRADGLPLVPAVRGGGRRCGRCLPGSLQQRGIPRRTVPPRKARRQLPRLAVDHYPQQGPGSFPPPGRGAERPRGQRHRDFLAGCPRTAARSPAPPNRLPTMPSCVGPWRPSARRSSPPVGRHFGG